MLQLLRKLPSDAKRKLALFSASFLTLGVVVFWFFNFFGVLKNSWNDAAEKTGTAYAAFEQNIEKAYNTMSEMIPKDLMKNNENTNMSTTTSTSTENMMYDSNNISTTTDIN